MANSFNRIAHHIVQKWKIDNNAHCIFCLFCFFAKIAKVCSEKKIYIVYILIS